MDECERRRLRSLFGDGVPFDERWAEEDLRERRAGDLCDDLGGVWPSSRISRRVLDFDDELDDELDLRALRGAVDECWLRCAADECGLGCHASRSRFAGVGACESADVYIEVAVERAECAREGALGGRGGGPEVDRLVTVDGLNALGEVLVPEEFGDAFFETALRTVA